MAYILKCLATWRQVLNVWSRVSIQIIVINGFNE